MIIRFSQTELNDARYILYRFEEGIKVDFDKLAKSEFSKNVEYFDTAMYAGIALSTFGIGAPISLAALILHKLKAIATEQKNKNHDIITVSFKDFFLFEDKIKKQVSESLKQGHKVNIIIEGDATSKMITGEEGIEYNYSAEKYLRMFDINLELKKLGMKDSIRFNEFFKTNDYTDLKTCWTLEEVLDATAEIDKIVFHIKDKNLSPYETMLYIHKYITSHYGYGFNATNKTKNRSSEKVRSIIGAIQNDKTVCAGFASLTKAIVEKLNMPGLKCNYQVVEYHGKNKRGKNVSSAHALNLVDIDDPKYGIKGKYANDTTWDCKTKKCPEGRGYAFFMYPIADMTNFRNNALTRTSNASRVMVFDYMYDGQRERAQDEQIKMSANPISLDSLTAAMTKVYSEEQAFCNGDSVETAVKKEIRRSMRCAWVTRILDGDNPLLKKADEIYNVKVKNYRSGILKSAKFTLKNENQALLEK